MQNGNIKKNQTIVHKVEFTAQKLTIRCRKNTDRTNVNVTLVAECFHIHILNNKSPYSVPPFRIFLPFPPPTLQRLFFQDKTHWLCPFLSISRCPLLYHS